MTLDLRLVRTLEAAASAAELSAALIGRGIRQSRTPFMHNAEGARLNLDYRYCRVDFDDYGHGDSDLEPVIRLAVRFGFRGFNITYPFKEKVVALSDMLAPEVDRIGAANTIVVRDHALIAHNTDCYGFAESFRRHLPGASLEHVLVVGAGGAGRAVAQALVELGAQQIAMFDVVPMKAAAVVTRLQRTGFSRAMSAASVQNVIEQMSGVINASPIGMSKFPGMPFPPQWIGAGTWVADVIYVPEETEFLKHCRAQGSKTLSGSAMAIHQAVRAFEYLTGRPSDPDAMGQHFAQAESALAAGAISC